jgi:preprotein translocase subunit SecA
MVEKALARRVQTAFDMYEDDEERDFRLLAQELMMHYLISLPILTDAEAGGAQLEAVQTAAVQAGRDAFDAKMRSFGENADRVLSFVMLNVLDEKWKDHLYDLDQLRGAIHYRSWGQKDPLIEYKQEAYTMFVDLMSDIAHTFAERFLRVQLMPAPQAAAPVARPPARRFNAMGVLEEVTDELAASASQDGVGRGATEPRAPGAGAAGTTGNSSPGSVPPSRQPRIVGPGISRSSQATVGAGVGRTGDWSNVGRNEPCPCGSGKKYKKCHGTAA